MDLTRGLLQTPSFRPISPVQQVSLESGGLDLPQESAAKVFPTGGACLEDGADRGSSEVLRWQKSQRLPRASPCCACCANLGRTEGESRDPLRLAERDTVGRGLWFLPATAY